MEEIQMISTLIGSLGFPIVACCYMAWMHNESETRHSKERQDMTDAINSLSTVLEVIKDRLGINGHD